MPTAKKVKNIENVQLTSIEKYGKDKCFQALLLFNETQSMQMVAGKLNCRHLEAINMVQAAVGNQMADFQLFSEK